MKVAVVLIAIALLVLLALIFTRRAKMPEPARRGPPPRKTLPVAEKPNSVESKTVEVATPTDFKPDAAAARLALGRCLATMSLDRTNFWAQHLEAMRRGGSREYREFSSAFRAAAGSDLLPIAKKLLEECASDEAKFLLAAVLGDARSAATYPLLQDLIKSKPSPQVMASVYYSIGLSQSPEGIGYLKQVVQTKGYNAKEFAYLYGPALAGLGLQGMATFEFMLAEARSRGSEQFPSKSDILGFMRGADALDDLRSLAGTEADRELKYGAAIALGASEDPRAFELIATLTEPHSVAVALLAARDIPDVWNATAPKRSALAQEYLSTNRIPTGDFARDAQYMTLAPFLSAEVARPLYESVTSIVPTGFEARTWIIGLVSGFATQPDLETRIATLAEAWRMSEPEVRRAVQLGLMRSSLPGSGAESSGIVQRMLGELGAKDEKPDKRRSALPPPELTLSTVMRSGISEPALSAALSNTWHTFPDRRPKLLDVALRAEYPMNPGEPLLWTSPDGFYEVAMREAPDLRTRITAAFAYFVASPTPAPDPDALQGLANLVRGGAWDLPHNSPAWRMVPSLIGNYYAQPESGADPARLQLLPQTFPYPDEWTEQQRGAFQGELIRETRRAIDAIRLVNP